MKKYDSLKKKFSDDKFTSMSKAELVFLTGGANVAGRAGGSQTSNTYKDNSTTCCDNTCVCTCAPLSKAAMNVRP